MIGIKEIDALCAVHVMGWVEEPRQRAGVMWFLRPDGGFSLIVPHYSTDPGASKSLRNRMFDLGWGYRLSRLSAECVCIFLNSESTGSGCGSTEEIATALAALNALSVEVPA